MTDTTATRRRLDALVEDRYRRIADDFPSVAAEVFAYWADHVDPAAVIDFHRRLVEAGDISPTMADPLLAAWLDDLDDVDD